MSQDAGSPLDRIEARPAISDGAAFTDGYSVRLSVEERDALVAVARAAEKLTGQPFGQLNERDFYLLREALSRIGNQHA